MLSYWERESLTKYDYIIVGGGIVGCSTAYHLKRKFPKVEVAIVERGIFPSGASSKNAGFACFGSLTELVDDREGLNEDQQLDLVEKRWQGLIAIKKILGEKGIGFESNGGYEVIREAEMPALEYLDHYNQLLKSVFKHNVYSDRQDLIAKFGFNKSDIKTIISNPFEGQIDTGKMIKSWWEICNQIGVKIISGCEVKEFEEKTDEVVLHCVSNQQKIVLKARHLGICTNAFSHKWYSKEDIAPGRGMVLITEEIKDLKFKGVFHYDKGYFYFRNVGNRVLIGGGRNLDKETENTMDFGINPKIKEVLLRDLKEFILYDQDFKVDMEWSGIMAFGKNKYPIVKRVSDRIALGVRLGGMGVAIGTQVGIDLSEVFSQ